MQQVNDFLTLHPPRQGLTEVTGEIAAWLVVQAVREGLLTLFLRHTSASLVIQENADADVLCATSRRSWTNSCPRTRRFTATAPKAPTTCRPTSRARSPRAI